MLSENRNKVGEVRLIFKSKLARGTLDINQQVELR